jgi:hypothetical protein
MERWSNGVVGQWAQRSSSAQILSKNGSVGVKSL